MPNQQNQYIERTTPVDFNFMEALSYLGRSSDDILHRIENGNLYKLLHINDVSYLVNVSHKNQKLRIEFLNNQPSEDIRNKCAKIVWDIFDLDRNLHDFYQMANGDPILAPLVQKYQGTRIVGINDLFETITWAIIGQQINLTFAYTLKRRLIEAFGEKVTHEGNTYWLFPTAKRMATLSEDDLKELQFTTRKAEYVIGVASLIANKELTKESLQKETSEAVHGKLVAIRGIGDWTAQYVMMRCLHIPSAFPISDVGLHNALKAQLKLDKKPTIQEIKRISQHWDGWQAYATFYLWRSLHD